MSKLGEYTQIRTGKLDANASSETGEYPFFTCSREPLKIGTYSYDCECVLVAGNGDLNVKYYSGKFEAYQRTYIIESRNKNELHVPYLYLFLDNYLETLRQEAIGGVIKYIKLGNLTEAEIPLPPLEEQKRIAEELDKISGLITKRKSQLENLDLLVKAKFVEMFGDPVTNSMGWEIDVLGNVTKSRLGKMLDSKKQTGESSYEYLANFNVKWFKFDLSELNTMDFDEKDQKEFALEKGDLLVCEGGEIGRCAVWEEHVKNCFFQKALHRIRCNTGFLNSYFLAWIFYFKATYNSFKDVVGSHATIPHLTGEKIKKLNIMLPPLDLQTQFADYVTKVEQTKTKLQQGLVQLETLYKARMQEYFE